MAKEILTNVFHMASPSQAWAGLWTHPDSNGPDYNQIGFWTDLAQTAEAGLIDGIFLADGLAVPDVYEGKPDAVMRAGAMFPGNDPMMAIPAMAAVTTHLSFGVTANTTFEPPYLLARRFTTLDHLTDGRVCWNIVTGFFESVAKAMGAQPVPHDERYEVAEDYMDLMYKLWEQAWDDDAAVRDRARRMFVRPEGVRRVQHRGDRYRFDGFYPSEPSPQRTPFLYSAGASAKGIAFAGRHAEAAFMAVNSKAQARRLVDAYREAAVHNGRAPQDIKVFNAATVIVAETEREARELEAECRAFSDPAGNLAIMSGLIGLDLAKYDLDDPIEYVESNAIQSVLEEMTTYNGGQTVRVRDLATFSGLLGRDAYIVGSVEQVCDELVAWVDETGIDGFNLTRTIEPRGLSYFVEVVVPELQNRGRYKTSYSEGTTREKLFPGSSAHLSFPHRAAAFRV